MTEPIYNQRIRPFTARSRAADKPTGTRCWGYIRVSTDKQVDGTSLESQELGIRAEAMKYRDHTFAEMVRDVTPGGKTRFCDRQGGRQLLGKMVPGDVLIISKVDRFSRSVVDGLNEMREIWRKGITIVCLDMGGEPVSFGDNGEILLFMLLLGAQMENKRRSERAKESWAREKAAGVKRKRSPIANPPYGYVAGVIDWHWRKFVVRLRHMFDFACTNLGYSKCDTRHLKLAERYGLLWWKSYSKTGPNGRRPEAISADYYLRWFRCEDELSKTHPFVLKIETPWVDDFIAGRLKPLPKPINPFFSPINSPGENDADHATVNADRSGQTDPRELDAGGGSGADLPGHGAAGQHPAL